MRRESIRADDVERRALDEAGSGRGAPLGATRGGAGRGGGRGRRRARRSSPQRNDPGEGSDGACRGRGAAARGTASWADAHHAGGDLRDARAVRDVRRSHDPGANRDAHVRVPRPQGGRPGLALRARLGSAAQPPLPVSRRRAGRGVPGAPPSVLPSAARDRLTTGSLKRRGVADQRSADLAAAACGLPTPGVAGVRRPGCSTARTASRSSAGENGLAR